MLGLLAHAAPISYRFPLPIWLYVVAGGAAVLVSAPAAALAVRDQALRERRGPDLYPLVRRLGPVVTAIGALLGGVALAGGLFSTTAQSQEFLESPTDVLTWVDFWVGLGIAAWLVGNAYERVAPLNVAARALDRVLARSGVQPLAYPARLGHSCTFSRFSPLELRPFVPEEWTVSRQRSAQLRLYGAGLRTDPALPSGGAAFVLTALATVVFDGWSSTNRFGTFQEWFWQRWSFLSHHVSALQTFSMLVVVVLFVGAYLLVTRASARGLAVTLIPIAAVYSPRTGSRSGHLRHAARCSLRRPSSC